MDQTALRAGGECFSRAILGKAQLGNFLPKAGLALLGINEEDSRPAPKY